VRRGVTRSDTTWEEEASFAIAGAGAKMDLKTIGIGAIGWMYNQCISKPGEPNLRRRHLEWMLRI
jgi:hypothetical protein